MLIDWTRQFPKHFQMHPGIHVYFNHWGKHHYSNFTNEETEAQRRLGLS